MGSREFLERLEFELKAAGLTAEEVDGAMGKYLAYFNRLREEGRNADAIASSMGNPAEVARDIYAAIRGERSRRKSQRAGEGGVLNIRLGGCGLPLIIVGIPILGLILVPTIIVALSLVFSALGIIAVIIAAAFVVSVIGVVVYIIYKFLFGAGAITFGFFGVAIGLALLIVAGMLLLTIGLGAAAGAARAGIMLLLAAGITYIIVKSVRR